MSGQPKCPKDGCRPRREGDSSATTRLRPKANNTRAKLMVRSSAAVQGNANGAIDAERGAKTMAVEKKPPEEQQVGMKKCVCVWVWIDRIG